MSVSRIQKLLFSEYCDFEDMVLIESPFAQTTKEGKGIRQVHLGLTPSKLILATDKLLPANEVSFTYLPGVDPDVETFELIAVYPLECLTFSLYHRRKHKSLKLHFCTNRILYFELGGFQKKKMFWNLWCEQVKYLSFNNRGSSHSETSVATSTTNSTLYLLSSRRVVTNKGLQQLWCKFGARDNSNLRRWQDRHLFTGSSFDNLHYVPNMVAPTVSQFLLPREGLLKGKLSLPTASDAVMSKPGSVKIGEVYPVNRFASGVQEKCGTALFLPAEDYIVPRRFSQTTQFTDMQSTSSYLDLCEVAENCVRQWEQYKETNCNAYNRKHKRRYGFAPQPHFLYGLGPWNVPPGGRYSLQIKRAVSCVTIRKLPIEPEFWLPVSKRQLTATISCGNIHLDHKASLNTDSIKNSPKSPVLLFWTPDYWYRPKSARDSYQELQSHLQSISKNHQKFSKRNGRKYKRRLFYKRRKKEKESTTSSSDDDLNFERVNNKRPKRSNMRLLRVFASRQEDRSSQGCVKAPKETPLQYLKRMLRMDVFLSAWDFDSTTLAQQLTMIDKELFLKIPVSELGVLLWQQSSKNAPNIGALLAFSHRITCLVATEVLRDDSEKIRARLVARFINVADKCDKMANFQSCKSILSGLQNPAVYRLHLTWSHVRKRHATKYHTYEGLCRLYRDPRSPAYQKAFLNATQNAAYLPYIGDVIARLLDKLPDNQENKLFRSSTKQSCTQIKPKSNVSEQKEVSPTNVQSTGVIRRLLSTLKIWPATETLHKTPSETKTVNSKRTENLLFQRTKFKNLLESYDKPIIFLDDNRVQKLNECMELLEKFQRAAMNYVLNKNELAREYLLKGRYREDKENFFNSFRMEPSHLMHSELWQYSKNCY